MLTKKSLPRIMALDYLRGFFICVIVIDHLWRWPNLFQYVTGRGEMWVSAAEGFVMISGLLVGYIYGYKKRNSPIKGIAGHLIKRGVMLYAWMIITTLVLTWVSWHLDFKGPIAYIPVAVGDWPAVIVGILKLDYVHSLTHFLYLYAIFLVLSPLIIVLLRRNLWWLVVLLSAMTYFFGIMYGIDWMQWQLLFYLLSVVGFYLDKIRDFLTHGIDSTVRTYLITSVASIAAVSFLWSLTGVLLTTPGEYAPESIFGIAFGRDPSLTIWTVLLAFTWFFTLLYVFDRFESFLEKYLGWLLLTFGQKSLTAYISHVIPVLICSLLLANTDNFLVNSLLCAAALLATWTILKIPHINKIIPR